MRRNGATNSPRGLNAHRALTTVLLAGLTVGLLCPSLSAQRMRGKRLKPNPPAIIIEPTAPVANLFSRAEEGIARADWKFAIDCLQRIIDDPQDSLLPQSTNLSTGPILYESARRRATGRLASLPPEGLRAYRLLFNGRAKRLYEEGRASGNSVPLKTVVDRFLVTRHGPDAADLLASWALDAGRPGEVVAILSDLFALLPDGTRPEPLAVAKMAAALALLGRLNEAEAVLETLHHEGDQGLSSGSICSLRPIETERVGRLDAWPMAGGSPARGGVMSAVEPTLFETIPWQYDLPGADPDAWRRAFVHDPGGGLTLPVRQLVTDGTLVFARTPWGCVALDLENLALVWESQDGDEAPAPAETPGLPPPQRVAAKWTQKMVFEDHVAGAVSVGHDLVLTVSRGGIGRYVDKTNDPDSAGTTNNTIIGAKRGSRLVAYDAATGKLRWSRGRTGHPLDPLGTVEFRSAPIAIGNRLWVPFLRQSDLSIAVLDPKDGSLERAILLCALGRPSAKLEALQPASADGMVFVPSGHGVLFAVDAATHTVRWASQYAATQEGQEWKEVDPRVWLSSPPIVTGGVVLLAPAEGDELLCLSASNGELRWSAAAPTGSYLVGADHERVWLGGRTVSCLSLLDGETIWSTDVAAVPTGQAVLSGDLIHVPTMEGLWTLAAATGDSTGLERLTPAHGPLGNLLCMRQSLYSINPSAVRKFPDIGRSYPIAVAAHRTDPTNLVVSLRLAWLEFLQGKPERAYEVLSHVPTSELQQDPRRANDVAHLRVESLLALADRTIKGDTADDEALAFLVEAQRTARSAPDLLRCGLAVADHSRATGKVALAYRQLWRIGIDPSAETVVALDEHVKGMSRFKIAQRLEEVAQDLSDEDRHALADELREQADELIRRIAKPSCRRAELHTLRTMVDLAPVGTAGRRALAALVSHHEAHEHYEQAEQLLREAAQDSDDPSDTLAGAMRLCRLYADVVTAEEGALGALVSCLDDLESRFKGAVIPGAVHTADWFGDAMAPGGSLAGWIAQLRASIDPASLTAHRQRVADPPVNLTADSVWQKEWTPRTIGPQMVRFDETYGAGVGRRLVLFSPGDQVSCFDPAHGDEPLWQTTLRVPGLFPTNVPARTGTTALPTRRAVSDGQMAVCSTKTGLFALGLATGRRIWIRPFDRIGRASNSAEPAVPMAARDGFLAATIRAGRLTLMRMLDGTTLWERDLREEPVADIWMVADRVLTVDSRRERVHVFDRGTGRLIKKMLYTQPGSDQPAVDLVTTGGVVCGPFEEDEFEGVVGMDVVSGEIVWRTKLDKPLFQLFEPKEGFLGIGLLGGDVRLLDAVTGELLFSERVAGAHAVTGGVLVDGTLVVRYADPQKRQNHRLAALDVATGDELWRREDLRALGDGSEPLRLHGGRIPATTMPDRRNRRRTSLTLLDTRTGQSAGILLQLPTNNTAGRLTNDFHVFSGAEVLLISTTNSIHAYRTERAAEPTQRGF